MLCCLLFATMSSSSVLTPDIPLNNISPFNTDDFNLHLSKKQRVAASVLGGLSATAVSSAAFATGGAATAGSAAKASIEAGVTNSIAMIESIDGIALAAFGVALAPMGFMLTLRVLNMVLSRV